MCPLNHPAVTGVATSCLRLANDLHHLSPTQTEIPSHGVGDLHARKLGFLQTITLEKTALLLRTEKDVLGNQLVARNIDQQILFLEMLADVVGETGEQTDGGRRDGGLRDEESSVDVALADDVVEGAHLLGADARGVGAEVHVDYAAVGLGVWV